MSAIWFGLNRKQFWRHYFHEKNDIKSIEDKKENDKEGVIITYKTEKRKPLFLSNEQIELLTRRNTKVLFDNLENFGNNGDVQISGIDEYDGPSTGILDKNANFFSFKKNGFMRFETVYDERGKETYLILNSENIFKAIQFIPEQFKKIPYNYTRVRSGGKCKTSHNRKYKNKKTKKSRK